MPGSNEWRTRNDSVADHLASIHARTKQVVPASTSNRTSYSLYPVCSPSSPIAPIEAPSLADLPPRPQSTSHDTVIFSGVPDHEPARDTAGEPPVEDFEPLVEDFVSQLSNGSQPQGRNNLLPGLGNGVHRRLPRPAGLAASPPSVLKGRPQTIQSLDTAVKRISRADTDGPSSSVPTSPEDYHGSSIGHLSEASSASSEPPLVPLQTHGVQTEFDRMSTVCEDDPANYDLVAVPPSSAPKAFDLEDRAIKLFSRDHLRQIFADPKLLTGFASFLNTYRPKSVRLLMFYLDAVKASRALSYSNAVAQALGPIDGHDFSITLPAPATSPALNDRAHKAFDALASDDLAAFIAHAWMDVVSQSIHRRITGTLAPYLREASEGLAEVFCLSDPARPDNPIVFASAQFQKTTQYAMKHCVGRNCRFLQGRGSDARAVMRIGNAIKAGKEHTEVFVNYRRDGQPFMNLVMIAPLHDARGTIRYFIGAQVDVSGLVKECSGLEGFRRLLRREMDPEFARKQDEAAEKDDFTALAEMFNKQELNTVQQHGGHMHRSHFDDVDIDDEISGRMSAASDRPRLLITDATTAHTTTRKDPEAIKKEIAGSGRLQGIYQHYLLIRPAPSLRILFTSPSLRIPGILQTPFLARIGGSVRVRGDLAAAFAEGRSVTAKVRWLPRPGADDEEGRSRWIHATPLLNHKGEVGVWMVVLVDGDSMPGDGRRRFRAAPPVMPPQTEQLYHAATAQHMQGSSRRGGDRGSRQDDRPSVQHHQRLTVGGTPISSSPSPSAGTASTTGAAAAAIAAAAPRTRSKIVFAEPKYDMAATYMPTRSDADPRKHASVSFFDDTDARPPRRTASAQSRRSVGT